MKTVYTPQLDPDLVHQLYLKAKAQDVPMTVLTRCLLREALELPPPPKPPRARARRRRSRKINLTKRQLAEFVAHASDASRQLDLFINTFGTLVQDWCRLAERTSGRRKHRRKTHPRAES